MVLGLSLPIDIPWERLCVSEDMIAPYDASTRPRWRSSLAVFGYEPPEEAQNYEKAWVSYLKVTSSLTGFQPDPDEVGLRDRRAYSEWLDPTIIEQYEETVTSYYPCYGAILEVTVTPKGTREELAKIPPSRYPYISDFEPKKRELYELVTDTGELMSRSLETVNVRKGGSTSDAHEVLDIFGGATVGVEGPKYGGQVGVQGQWGTRDVSQEQFENVRTTESGREMRESFSHTTQLTQMYHQLNSYHLGTNRAMFYVLPRPHVVETERTFVNGPRVLEGVQEFFLVVMRPRDDKRGLCVQAYLETAHLAAEPELDYPTSTDSFTFSVHQQAPPASAASGFGEDDKAVATRADSFTYRPPEGYTIDLDQGSSAPGCDYTVKGTGHKTPIVKTTRDSITVNGEVEATLINRFPRADIATDGHLDVAFTVYLKARTPTISSYSHTLYLTGRSVSSCPQVFDPGKQAASDRIVYERPIKVRTSGRVGQEAGMTIDEANRLRTEIGRQLVAGQAAADHDRVGGVRFTESDFLARVVSKLMPDAGHPDNVGLAQVKGLDAALMQKLTKAAPNATRRRLLAMSVAELADRLNITAADAARVRRALLGLEAPPPTGPIKWQRPPVKR